MYACSLEACGRRRGLCRGRGSRCSRGYREADWLAVALGQCVHGHRAIQARATGAADRPGACYVIDDDRGGCDRELQDAECATTSVCRPSAVATVRRRRAKWLQDSQTRGTKSRPVVLLLFLLVVVMIMQVATPPPMHYNASRLELESKFPARAQVKLATCCCCRPIPSSILKLKVWSRVCVPVQKWLDFVLCKNRGFGRTSTITLFPP